MEKGIHPEDNIILGLVRQGRRWNWPETLVLAFGLLFVPLCWAHSAAFALLVLLPLFHLVLTGRAIGFPRRLKRLGLVEDLLSTPVTGQQFAEAYRWVFWRATRACGFLLLAALSTTLLPGAAGKMILADVAERLPAFLLLGFSLFALQWLFFWTCLRYGLLEALLMVAFQTFVIYSVALSAAVPLFFFYAPLAFVSVGIGAGVVWYFGHRISADGWLDYPEVLRWWLLEERLSPTFLKRVWDWRVESPD